MMAKKWTHTQLLWEIHEMANMLAHLSANFVFNFFFCVHRFHSFAYFYYQELIYVPDGMIGCISFEYINKFAAKEQAIFCQREISCFFYFWLIFCLSSYILFICTLSSLRFSIQIFRAPNAFHKCECVFAFYIHKI